ncbi:Lrp/AsnC family transcriptional regulator [Candidatus Pacearchaeota archaeon]|nr:Lrp/AsnC family transcriptional regulator [Candidatus Pacearchaeota archaeon]
MEELNLKDKKILYELDVNARQTDSQIARKVGLSRDSVRYRINKLIDGGYINYFMTLINSMKLGYDWYRTFFKFKNLNIKKEEEIIAWLIKKASWITRVEGKWDLNTGVFAKNIYEYRDIINEFLSKYSNYVEKHEVSIVTIEWNYHRDYLLNRSKKITKPELMGFDKEEDYKVEKIDKIDYKILDVLLKNARMNVVKIAEKSGTTEMVVRHRIKKLIAKKIIIGFRPFLDVSKLGYEYFKLHLKLYNTNSDRKKEIINYIHAHPNTIHMTELVGGADIETEFQVRNNQEFYNCIREIREKYGKIIKDYEFMQYTKEYKFTYLPEGLK